MRVCVCYIHVFPRSNVYMAYRIFFQLNWKYIYPLSSRYYLFQLYYKFLKGNCKYISIEENNIYADIRVRKSTSLIREIQFSVISFHNRI